MGKIISIANNKGGVAKTTTTLNLSAALAKLGKRVLMIDLDPQASLSVNFGLEPLDVCNNIYNVLIDELEAEEIVCEIDENLYLIPANIELSKVELTMMNKLAREYILKKKLEPIKDKFDYIIIDNSPSLGLLTINSFMASDYIISPTDPTYLAMRGLEILHEIINEVKTINPDVNFLGVVITMYDSRITHHKEVMSALKNRYHVFDSVVKRSIKFSDCNLGMTSIIEYAGKGFEGSRAYMSLAREVIKHG